MTNKLKKGNLRIAVLICTLMVLIIPICAIPVKAVSYDTYTGAGRIRSFEFGWLWQFTFENWVSVDTYTDSAGNPRILNTRNWWRIIPGAFYYYDLEGIQYHCVSVRGMGLIFFGVSYTYKMYYIHNTAEYARITLKVILSAAGDIDVEGKIDYSTLHSDWTFSVEKLNYQQRIPWENIGQIT